MKFSNSLLFSAVSIAFSAPIVAEEQSPIIVTATRTAQTADASLASVTVITRDDLEASQAQTIVEILQTVTGIHVSRSGGIGKITSIYMRGTESDHTLVLIDGVRASSATSGGYSWNSLSPEQIERIEIVRGPRASLYGSDAIGGVIQIFTRKNKRSQIQLGYGSQDTRKMSINLAGGDEWKYSFNTGLHESNGIPIRPNGTETRGYDNTHAAFTLDGNINDNNKLSININHSQGTNELDPGTGNQDFINRIINVQLQQKTSANWSQTLSLGNALDEFVTHSPSNPATITTKRHDISWQNDFSIGNSLLTAGLDYRMDNAINDSNTIDNTIYNKAIFAEYQFNMMNSDWNIGARRDQNSVYGSNNTWNIALGHDITNQLRFTASHGTSFKAPSVNDIYWPFRSDPCWWDNTQTCITQGNINIKPEEAKTSELGLSYKIKEYSVSANIFSTETINLIDWETFQTGATEYTTTPSNVNKARIEGIELQLDMPLGEWQTSTRLTYLKAINEETKLQLDRRPKKNLAFIAQRSFGKHSVYSEIIAHSKHLDGNGSLEKSGYVLVNLTYGYQLEKDSKINLRVDNLLDKEYVVASSRFSGDYNTPGTTFFLSYTRQF